MRRKTRGAVKAGAAIAALAAAIACALYLAVGGGAQQAVLAAQGKQVVKVTVSGEGVEDAEAMPIVYLKKVDAEGNRQASWLHLMGSASEEYVVDAGAYEVTLATSPVLADGTLYRFADGACIAYDGPYRKAETRGGGVSFEISPIDAGEDDELDVSSQTSMTAFLTYKAEKGLVTPLTADDGVASGGLYEDTCRLLAAKTSAMGGAGEASAEDPSALRDSIAEAMIAKIESGKGDDA